MPTTVDHRVELGPDFVADSPATSPGELVEAIRNRRPGEAWAISDPDRVDDREEPLVPRPGRALHGAICRAAGVWPTEPGVIAAVARALGWGRAAYHRLISTGGVGSTWRLARQLGYYLVVLPDGRSICGDHPMDLAAPRG